MGNYLKTQAARHKVTHEFSGKSHFFNVETAKGESHSVIIQAGCDCTFMSVQGITNGKICSHVLAVLNKIVDDGEINKQ